MAHEQTARLRRWAGVVAVALVVAAGCVTAGIWQWNRHEQRSVAAALVEANHGARPVDLDDLVGADGTVADDDVWRPVRVRGHYVGGTVLLRNRPVDSTPAYHVLSGVEVADGEHAGSVLVVDRGWVPAGPDGASPRAVPTTPPGDVTLVVRLRAAEPSSDRDAPDGQVQAITPDDVRGAGEGWSGRTLDAYGVLATEDDARPAGLRTIPPPDTSLGTHLSYTFQWWVFALCALGGAVVLIRRDRAADAAEATHVDDDASPARERASRPVRARRRPTAEEEEDAILDRQATGR